MNRTRRWITCSALAVLLSAQFGASASAHGVIDQSNLVDGGAQQILAHQPIGQEFTPSQPLLVAVDIALFGSAEPGSGAITVNIRQETITAPVLATTSQVVSACQADELPFTCMVHFDFPAPVLVTPGMVYVLELQTTTPIHAWQGDAFGGDYPGGSAIIQGIVDPHKDYGFQTYAQPLLQIGIDVRPGHDTNVVNLKSNGFVRVAMLTTPSFDASTVDLSSLRFGPAEAHVAHGRGHSKDVDGDGDRDLVVRFRTKETGLKCGMSSATLTGTTKDSLPISGSDSITVKGCRRS
jgi:hypothetical protein